MHAELKDTKTSRNVKGKSYGLFAPVFISFVVVLALFMVIIVYNYLNNVGTMEKSIMNYNLQISNEIKVSVDDKLNMSMLKLYDFCYDKRVLTYASVRDFYEPSSILDALDVISLSNSACITHSQLKNIFIYYPNTNVILDRYAYFEPGEYFKNISELGITGQQWQHLLEDVVDFKFLISPMPNQDIIILKSVPLTGINRPMVQVGVRVSGKEIASVLNSLSTVNSMYAYIITDDGEVISQTANAIDYKLLQLSDISTMEPGAQYMVIDNVKSLVTITKSVYTNWNYMTVIPTTSFMGDLMSVRMVSALLSVALFMLLFLMFLFVKRKSYEPVRGLVNSIKEKYLNDDNVSANEVQIISDTLVQLTQERERIQRSMNEQYPVIKNNMLLSLVEEIEMDESLFTKMEEIGITFPHDFFVVLSVEIEEAPRFKTFKLDERILIKTIVSNIAEDVFRLAGEIQVASINWNKMVMVINSGREPEELSKMVYECSQEYVRLLKSLFSLIVTIGISTCDKGLDKIGQLFQEAEEALAYKLVSGINSVNQFRSLESNVNNYFYPTYMEHKLINSVAAGNEEQALEILRTIFEYNFKDSNYPVKYSKCLFFDIISTVLKLLNEIKVEFSDIFEDQFDTEKELLDCKTVDEMYQVVRMIIIKICRHVKSKMKSKNEKLIQKIVEYINNNYNDPNICINSIAEAIQITQTYLSHYFKEKMGISVMKYIEKLRIDHVKELLSSTEKTLAEITKETGFSNSAVLIRTFKKIEGITPGQFRKIAIKPVE